MNNATASTSNCNIQEETSRFLVVSDEQDQTTVESWINNLISTKNLQFI